MAGHTPQDVGGAISGIAGEEAQPLSGRTADADRAAEGERNQGTGSLAPGTASLDVVTMATPKDDLSLRVYRDLAALEELRGFWSSMQIPPSGNLDFFQAIVCSAPDVVRPHVMVVFKAGQPRALLPGRLERGRIEVKIGYFRLPTPILNILTFDTAGWLKYVSAAESELFIKNIMDQLQTGEADAANLQHMDEDHPLQRLAKSLPGSMWSDHCPVAQVHWTRQFRDAAAFFESLSANERYNQRRRLRRLTDTFRAGVRIESFHDRSCVEQLMNDAETIAKSSYQRGLGVGFVNDASMRLRLRFAAEQGVLCAYVLYLGSKPSAFWITTLSGGVLYNDFMAFDPAYAKFGPGAYLAIHVIEAILTEDRGSPLRGVDFGPGDAEWKARLGNHRAELVSRYVFAPKWKATVCNLLRMLAYVADCGGKLMLRRAGVLTYVKRRWRRRLMPE